MNKSNLEKCKFITLDNEEYFNKKFFDDGIVYINKNYQGPIAIDHPIKKMN